MPVSVRREITEQRETMHVVAHSFCMCSHVSCAVSRINQLNSFLPCSLVAVVLCRTVQRHFKSKEVMPAFMQRVLSLAVNAVAHFCGRRLHRFCVRLSSFDCRFTCIPTASPFCTTCALQAGCPQLFISAFCLFCVACGERQKACDM
jgi:hypothetical protein